MLRRYSAKNTREYGFSLTRILQYKNRIYDLCSAMFFIDIKITCYWHPFHQIFKKFPRGYLLRQSWSCILLWKRPSWREVSRNTLNNNIHQRTTHWWWYFKPELLLDFLISWVIVIIVDLLIVSVNLTTFKIN